MSESGMTRRKLLLGAAAVGLGASAAIATTGPPFARGERTISFWHLFSGGDGARMAEMLDDFAGSGTDIKVEPVTLTWGPPYYTKLSLAAVGGRPPDVAISHATRLGAYAPAGLFEPLSEELLAKHGITPDRFTPEVWKSGQYEGTQYMIPLDTHPWVLYYNEKLAKKAGLLDGDQLKPMDGPDQVLEAFTAMKKATGQYGVSFECRGVTPWRMWLALYGQQNGGPLFSEDGQRFTMEDEKGLRALEFMASITGKKLAADDLDYPASVAFFSNGAAGFHLNGEWEVTTFQAAKMPFNMVPIPKVFQTQMTQGDQHTFVIPKNPNRAPERLDAALGFIKGMLDRSYTWAQGGHVPSWRPVLESEKYRKLSPQSNYAAAANRVARDPIIWFSGSGSDLENEAGAAFQTVLGGAKPEAGLRQFRAAMEQFLDKPKPV